MRSTYNTDAWLLVPRIPTLDMLRVIAQPQHPIDYLLGQDMRNRGRLAIPRIYHLETAAGQYVRMLSLVPAGPLATPVDSPARG